MKTQLLIILIFIFSSSVFAQEMKSNFDNFALKAGFGAGATYLRSQSVISAPHSEEERKNYFVALSLSTHLEYTINRKWAIALSSYVAVGNVDKIRIKTDSGQIAGNGAGSSVSYGFIAQRAIAHNFQDGWTDWKAHYKFGPMWGLSTFRVKNGFQILRGDYESEYKVTYTTYGILLGVGVEEQLAKALHPVYIDLTYHYMHSYQMAIVDSKDYREVNTLSEQRTYDGIEAHVLLLSIGVTLF